MIDDSDYSWADSAGKFVSAQFRQATAYVYDLIPDEIIGSVDELGWYGLIYLTSDLSDKVASLDWEYIPESEPEPRDKPSVAIVYEDTQGFVTATFYVHESLAEKDWKAIVENYEGFYKAEDNSGDW